MSLGSYEFVLSEILTKGDPKGDRTGHGTRSIFGQQLVYDLAEGFPLLTSKKIHFKSVLIELLWFLRGDTNTKFLHEHGVTIWDEWANADGDLGPVYGHQWRSWDGAEPYERDQISMLLDTLTDDPNSRRMIVSAWNVGQLPHMALPPCHVMFQCYVSSRGKLSLQVYQRSADWFLGVPFNIASYALLLRMLAAQTGLEPGRLIWTGGDCHLYNHHTSQAQILLSRPLRAFPELQINPEVDDLFHYLPSDFELLNYDPHPAIKADVAI